MQISVHRLPHVELHYQILSRLDLGRDGANLFHKGQSRSPRWSKKLLRAYREAPGALILQILPLLFPDMESQLEGLRTGTLPGFSENADMRLRRLFADVLESQMADEVVSPEKLNISWLPMLESCRETLWRDLSTLDKEPPPLRILDVPALKRGAWTFGRATYNDHRHIVAVSLDVPWEHALIQVLHEEIHPVTDPAIRRRFSGPRSTAEDSQGFELHRRLEQKAVSVGEKVLRRCASELLTPYKRWRRYYGV